MQRHLWAALVAALCLLGCKEDTTSPIVTACSSEADCPETLVCNGSFCVGPEAEDPGCLTNAECGEGLVCDRGATGECVEPLFAAPPLSERRECISEGQCEDKEFCRRELTPSFCQGNERDGLCRRSSHCRSGQRCECLESDDVNDCGEALGQCVDYNCRNTDDGCGGGRFCSDETGLCEDF